MDAEFVKEVIHELRTTECKQITHQLVGHYDSNCRCANGVACCIEERRGNLTLGKREGRYVIDGTHMFTVPDLLTKQLGSPLVNAIIIWNDVERLSFNEIADRLEHYLQEHSCEN